MKNETDYHNKADFSRMIGERKESGVTISILNCLYQRFTTSRSAFFMVISTFYDANLSPSFVYYSNRPYYVTHTRVTHSNKE